MKSAFAAACAAGVLASQPALSAPAVWQGVSTITAATPACGASEERPPIVVGSLMRTLFRPKGPADNGEDARLSFIHDGQAHFAVILPGGVTPSGTYSAFGLRYGALMAANETGEYRKLVIKPAAPNEATTFIEASGAIQNFMFVTGCTVQFRAAFSPRI